MVVAEPKNTGGGKCLRRITHLTSDQLLSRNDANPTCNLADL